MRTAVSSWPALSTTEASFALPLTSINSRPEGRRERAGAAPGRSRGKTPTGSGQTTGLLPDSRSVEIVLDEWGAEFGGIDPIKPAFRQELNEAKQDLLTAEAPTLFAD
jgi:hypothetical protein